MKTRCVYSGALYCQRPNEPPEGLDFTAVWYSDDADAEFYKRRGRATTAFQAVSTGWAGAGTLLIANMGAAPLLLALDSEGARVFAVVEPNRHAIFKPVGALYAAAAVGECSYRVAAIPG